MVEAAAEDLLEEEAVALVTEVVTVEVSEVAEEAVDLIVPVLVAVEEEEAEEDGRFLNQHVNVLE